jgi:hypothetical protein
MINIRSSAPAPGAWCGASRQGEPHLVVVTAVDSVRCEVAMPGPLAAASGIVGRVDEREDVELAELAALIRERNALDARIGRLLDRPVNPGNIGEWIAARIFDVELEAAANAPGYDGHFTTGALAGQTVNVKAYGMNERMFAINPTAPLDYYLVLTGPKGQRPVRLAGRLGRSASTPFFCLMRTVCTPSLKSVGSSLALPQAFGRRSGSEQRYTRARTTHSWLSMEPSADSLNCSTAARCHQHGAAILRPVAAVGHHLPPRVRPAASRPSCSPIGASASRRGL